jgi:hypothetical protein
MGGDHAAAEKMSGHLAGVSEISPWPVVFPLVGGGLWVSGGV